MSWFGRAELGETDDPADLVPGSAAKIDESVSNMRSLPRLSRRPTTG
ncbi:hypothetical protein [Lentzea sp. NBRC 105346]|nr:hypothetical protein [Lentzea sp. NBRC 105346]